MKRRTLLTHVAPTIILGGLPALHAEIFLTQNQAGSVLYPGQSLHSQTVRLSSDQVKAISRASGVRVRSTVIQAWRTGSGDWLIYDSVIGKHEFIDIAVAISRGGQVRGVEILTYRETYGDQVKGAGWRGQFKGKSAVQPVKIDSDIKNISGATLSSVHVTDGVRRLLHTHALVLKSL